MSPLLLPTTRHILLAMLCAAASAMPAALYAADKTPAPGAPGKQEEVKQGEKSPPPEQRQDSLSRAQDRVAEHYKRSKAQANGGDRLPEPRTTSEKTDPGTLPAIEPPAGAGMRGGGAEAHSEPVK